MCFPLPNAQRKTAKNGVNFPARPLAVERSGRGVTVLGRCPCVHIARSGRRCVVVEVERAAAGRWIVRAYDTSVRSGSTTAVLGAGVPSVDGCVVVLTGGGLLLLVVVVVVTASDRVDIVEVIVELAGSTVVVVSTSLMVVVLLQVYIHLFYFV